MQVNIMENVAEQVVYQMVDDVLSQLELETKISRQILVCQVLNSIRPCYATTIEGKDIFLEELQKPNESNKIRSIIKSNLGMFPKDPSITGSIIKISDINREWHASDFLKEIKNVSEEIIDEYYAYVINNYYKTKSSRINSLEVKAWALNRVDPHYVATHVHLNKSKLALRSKRDINISKVKQSVIQVLSKMTGGTPLQEEIDTAAVNKKTRKRKQVDYHDIKGFASNRDLK